MWKKLGSWNQNLIKNNAKQKPNKWDIDNLNKRSEKNTTIIETFILTLNFLLIIH